MFLILWYKYLIRHKLRTSRSSEKEESAFCMDWKHWTFHEWCQLQMLFKPVRIGTIQLRCKRCSFLDGDVPRHMELGKTALCNTALAQGAAEHVTAIKKRETKCTELADVSGSVPVLAGICSWRMSWWILGLLLAEVQGWTKSTAAGGWGMGQV